MNGPDLLRETQGPGLWGERRSGSRLAGPGGQGLAGRVLNAWCRERHGCWAILSFQGRWRWGPRAGNPGSAPACSLRTCTTLSADEEPGLKGTLMKKTLHPSKEATALQERQIHRQLQVPYVFLPCGSLLVSYCHTSFYISEDNSDGMFAGKLVSFK